MNLLKVKTRLLTKKQRDKLYTYVLLLSRLPFCGTSLWPCEHHPVWTQCH